MVWLQGAQRERLAPPHTTPGLTSSRPPALGKPAPAVARAEPQAITPEVPAPAASAPAMVRPVPSPEPPASAPLNLTLPRDASAPWSNTSRGRHPALDDPRGNTTSLSLERRIAAALGGNDQVTEFRLADGSVRLERGNACVVVRPNRASGLDPFNADAQNAPRLLDRC
jgi:hypothetical protein